MTNDSSTRPHDAESPAARLDRLLRSNACIAYHRDIPDREYPQVKCSIYGAPKTNELFVKVTNGEHTFVAVAPSPVSFPVMADRIFGIDVADEAVALGMADQIWDEHKSILAKVPSVRRKGT